MRLSFQNKGLFQIGTGLSLSPRQRPSLGGTLLVGWIRRNHELEQKLTRYGYHGTDRIFTPKQVEVLVEFLGEP